VRHARFSVVPAVLAVSAAMTMGVAGQSDTAAILERAKEGNVPAIYLRGVMRETGDGLPRDLAEAARSYDDAAARGYAPAMARLGYLHETGAGVPRDEARAFSLYQRASETSVEGQFLLGTAYVNGVGTPKDARMARRWLAKAAAAGHQEAQLAVALMLLQGTGGSRNDFSAHRWLTRAKEGPDTFLAGKAREVQDKLGRDLFESDGVSVEAIILGAVGLIALASLADDGNAASPSSTYQQERQMRRLRQEQRCAMQAFASTRTAAGMMRADFVCRAGIY
jgi:localization factor PodJL